uniref:Kinetochore-associated protein 1 n=1 Tax=Panagrolaimus sp. JU765 TaxID=591449 RepID=A0AC34Q5K0_9BILA
MNKFTRIDAHSKEGDTSLNLNLKSNNLYEVRTGFDIESACGFDYENKPEVYFASSKKQAAVGVGSVVHLVNLESDIKPKEPKVFEYDVAALNFFGNGRLLVVVLENGNVAFADCSNKLIKWEIKEVFTSCVIKSSLYLHQVSNDEVYMVVLDPYGKANVARFRYYGIFMNRKSDDAFTSLADSVHFVSSHAMFPSVVVPYAAYGLLFLPKELGHAAVMVLQEGECPFIQEMYEFEFGVRHAVACGLDLIVLSDQNKLHYMDLISGYFYKESDIRLDAEFDRQIIKFEIVDYKVDIGIENLKVLLLIDCGDYSELQVRLFAANKVQYRVKTSKNALILPFTTEKDNSIVFTDPFSSKRNDSILIRYIDEVQPDARLDKLLYNARYDEAEEFAKLYNLNLEKVHQTRVMEMIRLFDDTDATMKSIFHYCDLISDENQVADLCVWAINSFKCRPYIQKFLEYALRKNVTDAETILMIKRRHFDFATICAISTNNEEFHAEIWKKLVENEDAPYILFKNAFAVRELTAARILWSRYNGIISQYFEAENEYNEFFDYLREYASKEVHELEQVVEFVQRDIGPAYLMNAKDDSEISSRGESLIEFTLQLVKNMEKVDPENFPENSLLAAGLMKNLLDNIRTESISCQAEAKVYKILGILKAASEVPSTPMAEVNIRLENYKKMLYLKKKYDCNLTYDEYAESDAKTICFGILGRFTISQTITKEIKNIVFPYLKEFKLNPDDVLLSYIKESSRSIGVTCSHAATWDGLCIGITRCINSIYLRGQAVLDIAQKSYFPWSPELKKAVNEMLEMKSISPELRKALVIQCRREELGNLFLELNIPLNYLEDRIGAFDLMSLFPALLHSFKDDLISGLGHCRHICDLLEAIQGKNMDKENIIAICMVQAAVNHLSEGNYAQLNETLSLISTKKAKIDAVAYFLGAIENFSDETHRIYADRRLELLDIGILLIDKYYDDLVDAKEWRRRLLLLYTIQKEFDLIITRTNLKHRKELMEIIMDYARNQSKSTFDSVVKLGMLVGFTRGEVSMLYSEAFDNEFTALYTALLCLSSQSDDLTEDDIERFLCVKDLFFSIREFSCRTSITPTAANNVITNILGLHIGVQNVYLAACRLGMFDETVFLNNLLNYVNLFREMVVCFAEPSTQQVSDSHANVIGKGLSLRINEMSNRFASLVPKDMSTLYDPIECFQVMTRIGVSALGDEELNEQHSKMLGDDWLNALLALKVHPFLEYSIRQLCPAQFADDSDLKQNVTELCQKIVTAPKVDLVFALVVIFQLDLPEIEAVIKDLYKWAKNQHYSRCMYYVTRLAQVVLIISGRHDLKTNICKTYKSAFWLRCFGVHGIVVKNVDYPKLVQADFVAGLGEPFLFATYCRDYGLSADESLMSYGFELLRLLAKEEDEIRRGLIQAKADSAFRYVKLNPKVFIEKCFGIIGQLCPYTYEAVDVLLEVMFKIEPKNIVIKDYICLLNFLKNTERKSEYTDTETKWYLERQRRIEKALKENSDDDMDSEMEVDHEFIAFDEKLINANEVMPKISRKRLPLHLFLDITEEMLEKYVEPILRCEVDLGRVKKWAAMIVNTTSVCRISRSLLIANAIGNKVREVITNKAFLTEKETLLIAELMNLITKKKNVLQQLATQINKLPLCMSKIEVYNLLLQCADQLIHSPNDYQEREAILDLAEVIRKYLKKLKVELLLDEQHITVDSVLLRDPEKLIQLIFTDFTNWNDTDDIATKMKLARKICSIHELNLDDILISIVDNYLNGDNIVGYLQPAITGSGSNENLLEEKNLFLPLPFHDVDVVRLAHILKELDSQSCALKVANKLRDENVSTAALVQKLKLLCVFIRYLTDNQFLKYFGCPVSSFGDQMSTLILQSALSFCNVNMTLKEFHNLPPLQIVTMLLNLTGGIKSCRETYQLAAALIIDHEIKEQAIVEKVLKRLHQYKCYDSLIALLRYAVTLVDGKFSENLSNYYVTLFDYKFDILKRDDAIPHSYRDLVYFTMSSPPGKISLSILNALKKMNMPIARKKLHSVLEPFAILPAGNEKSSNFDIKPNFELALTNIGDVLEDDLHEENAIHTDETQENMTAMQSDQSF